MNKFLLIALTLFSLVAKADVSPPAGTKTVYNNEAYNRNSIYILRNLYFADGSNHTMRVAAPSSLSGDSYSFIFPGADGTSGQCLATDGAQGLSFESVLRPGLLQIVNADVSNSAAIAYGKLNLSGSIATGDLSSGLLVPITNGGTGQTTANGALNAFLPSQTGNSGKGLTTNGTDSQWTTLFTNPMTTAGDVIYGGASGTPNRLAAGSSTQVLHSGTAPSWGAVSLTADVTGTLPVANGGTGTTTSTGTGSVVLSNSPALTTPDLGVPSAVTLTNGTGLPIPSGVTGTLSVAKGGTGVTTSTGSGNVVLSTSPTLVTPALGTPSAAVLTNATALPLTTGVTGTLPIANGGTGQTTANAAFNALSPMSTLGDMIYGSTAGVGSRVAPNTTSQIKYLSMTGTGSAGAAPVWSQVNASTDLTGQVPISNGGTGASNKANAFDALSPMNAAGDVIYGGTSGTGTRLANGTSSQVLHSGTTPSWGSVSLTAEVSGTLPVANGGTGVTSSSGSGSVVLSTSPTLVTPALGTPSALVLTNATSLPLTSGVTGTLPVGNGGTGVTTSTGSGNVVLSNSPTLVTPALGTPSAAVLTNATALPLTTGVTGTLPVANGGTNVTSVTTAPAATAFAGWDSSKNLSANSLIAGYTTTATAAGTTTLTVASAQQQYFTGSTTQTVALPAVSTLALGQSFQIVNNSSGTVTVQSSGGNTVLAMAGSTAAWFTCISTSGTSASSWNAEYSTQSPGTVTSVAMTVPSFLSVSGSPVTSSGTLALTLSGTALPLANGGTGQTTKSAAFDALSPMTTAGDVIYGGTSGTGTRLGAGTSVQLLHSGTTPSWGAVSLTADVTGTLPAGNGGTGITSLGSGIATWLGTPSSANLASALTDELGTGNALFGTSGTFTATFDQDGGAGGTATSITVTYQKHGGVVTLSFPSTSAAINCNTSNQFKISTQGSQLAAGLSPATNLSFPALILNNGLTQNTIGRLVITSGGAIQFLRVPDGTTNFSTGTGAGAAGFQPFAVTYIP